MPVNLLLDKDKVFNESSRCKARPRVPVRLSEFRLRWVTRFEEGLHWMKDQEQGRVSSSFHEERTFLGSVK